MTSPPATTISGNSLPGTNTVTPGPPATTVSAGYKHACEIVSGKAYCWGDNNAGELGNNSTTSSHTPVAVSTGGVLSGVTLVQISAGYLSTCAVSSAGAVYCWGDDTYGQLGNNSTVNSSVPVAVPTGGVPSGVTLTQVSTGDSFACAVSSAGAVYCWGWNINGQLGNNSTVNSSVPVAVSTGGVPSGVTLTQVSTGDSFACAVGSAGAVYCWGWNINGQLGNNSTVNSSVPVAVSTGGVLSGVTLTQVSTGYYSACAVSSAGAVYCWGYNTVGELGNNSTTDSSVPVAVSTGGVLSGVTVTQVSTGYYSACAVSSAGAVYCWGYNIVGELGNNSTADSSVPVAVSTGGTPMAGTTVTQVSASVLGTSTCAMDSAGTAYCWGSNSSGQLGNNSTTESNVPVAVMPLNATAPGSLVAFAGNASAVVYWAASTGTTGTVTGYAVLASPGSATCSTTTALSCTLTGLTNGTTYTVSVVATTSTGNSLPGTNTVTPWPSATTMSTGYSHACEIVSGKAYCWGDDTYGELGNNSTTQSNVPVAVNTGGVLSRVTLTQISAGDDFTCALSAAGAVYCWGNNGNGELGNNSTTQSLVPVAVTTTGTPMAGKTITQVSTGSNSSACAVDTTGLVYCWGNNGNGELGNNSTTQSLVPVAVTTSATPMAGRTIVQVSAGGDFACAVDTTGLVYCWGYNSYGELGNNSTTQSLVPVAVTTSATPMAGRTIVQVSAGNDFVCAVDSSGPLYCWGDGGNGELGNYAAKSSPVPVAVYTAGMPIADQTIVQVSAGAIFACAVDTAGLVYCWGYNGVGQLGNSSTNWSSIPVAVTTTPGTPMAGRTIVQVSAGRGWFGYSACAVDTASLAYCWGQNTSGQLGNNSVTQADEPVAVWLPAATPGSVAAFAASGSAAVYWAASAGGRGR